MTNALISIAAFALGLFPIWRIFAFEKAAGASLSPFTTIFFLGQHMAYSFAGALLAIADKEHTYFNHQGTFAYSDAMIKWQFVNLVAVVSAWLGVEFTKRFRTIYSKKSEERLVNESFRGICYTALGFHAVITTAVWYISYVDVPAFVQYIITMLSGIIVTVFFFWGLFWNRMSYERLIFIAYAFVYGGIQMVSGGRGPFVIGVFLFLFGYFLRRGRRTLGVDLIAISCMIAVLLFVITISENVRNLYAGRKPGSMAEWISRGGDLSKAVRGDEGEDSVSAVIARTAATIIQFSPFDVVARTPEEIPFKGWTRKDWNLLFNGFLPEFGPSWEETAYTSGSLAVQEYGWHSNPVEGHAMPMTLMADAWCRFGYWGVTVVNFVWAILLTNLSVFFGRRNSSRFLLILGASFIAIVYHLYAYDILALISPLPRRIVICLGYALFVYLASMAFDGILNHYRTPNRLLRLKEPTFRPPLN